MTNYKIKLKEAYLAWGEYRDTANRDAIQGEAYLPIPAKIARENAIYNSNHSQNGIGYNQFNFSTADGFISSGTLKAGGSRKKGDIYAKNFHGSGDLKLLGQWFNHIRAEVGDEILVEFTSPNDIVLTKK